MAWHGLLCFSHLLASLHILHNYYYIRTLILRNSSSRRTKGFFWFECIIPRDCVFGISLGPHLVFNSYTTHLHLHLWIEWNSILFLNIFSPLFIILPHRKKEALLTCLNNSLLTILRFKTLKVYWNWHISVTRWDWFHNSFQFTV